MIISARKIWNFWYIKKTQEWMNRVIYQCIQKHHFYNRLVVNIPNGSRCNLPCSLSLAESMRNKKRYVELNDFFTCPSCKYNDVDSALFFSTGNSYIFSDPHLMFFCNICIKSVSEGIFDYRHPPVITRYDIKYWYDLTNNIVI